MTTKGLTMPSKVMDKKYISMPERNVVESDKEWERCGKWIISHPHADLKFVDLAWTALQPLRDGETLLLLKASTAKMAKEGAIVLCYTKSDKDEAKRAAEAIRREIDFFGSMYYKLNQQTSQGVANRFGNKNVSIYMQTFRGVFYTKENGSWQQDIEEDTKNMQIPSKFNILNYSGNEELLSTYEGKCIRNLPANYQWSTGNPNWHMFCNCRDGGGYLSEADRVWIVAKQLFEEGLFVGIALLKAETSKCAEVRFYVSQYCDVRSRLETCDKIFKEASSRTIMYFIEGGKRKPKPQERFKPLHDFEYTSSGELYRRTNYGLEYVFS